MTQRAFDVLLDRKVIDTVFATGYDAEEMRRSLINHDGYDSRTMSTPYCFGTIREFNTRQFHVIVDALEDYDADLSWDDTGEVRAKLESGEYVCFTARARVFYQGAEIAADYLGGCIYADIAEFQDHRQCAAETRKLRAKGSDAICGSYFADMVLQVCEEARKRIGTYRNQYIRAITGLDERARDKLIAGLAMG